MAGGIELASAYVTIIPSLKGASKTIAAQLGGIDVSKAGSSLGKALGSSMSKALGTGGLDKMYASVSKAKSGIERALREQEDAAKKAEVAQKRLAEATARYGEDSSQAMDAARRLASAQRDAASADARAEGAVESLRTAQRQLTAAMEAAGTAATNQSSRLSRLASAADSAGDRLQSAGAKMREVGGGFEGLSDIASVGDRLTQSVTMPLLAAGGAAGAFAIKTAASAETAQVSFTTMLGSEEAALDMMGELADFAARTPFELSGLQTAARQLLAYRFEAEEVIPTLTAVGDATAALGTGQEGINAVTRALGQMQTRGKVSAEEMLQLTEAGIPAWEYLAEAIGTDTAGAMEAVTEGTVSASEGIQAVVNGMENDFGGMMEEQSRTVEGLMSNLSDAIQQPLMELRNSDAYDSFADSLERVVDASGPFVESLLPHMESGLEGAAGVLDSAADAMEAFADMSEEGQSEILGMVGAVAALGPALSVGGRALSVLGSGVSLLGRGAKGIGALAGKLASIGSSSSKGATGMQSMATATAEAATATGSLNPLLGRLGVASGVALAGYGLLTAAISDVAGLDEANAAFSRTNDLLGGFGAAVASAEPYSIDLQNTLSEAGNSLADLESQVQTSAANISAALKQSLQETGTVTPEATEEYGEQIQIMLKAAEESANTYAKSIENVSQRVGQAQHQMGGEELAQYSADVQSAYSQAKDACESNLNTMLTSIEQYHSAKGTLDSKAYEQDVQRAKDAYARQSEAIDEAYSEQLQLTGDYAKQLSSEQSDLWADLADQADELGDSWHRFWQDTSGIAASLDEGQFKKIAAQMTDGYTAAWMAAQVATVEGGGQLDAAARQNAENFLRVFDGLPPQLQDEGTESMRSLAESIEASGVELGDVANMSGQQIVDALREKLGIAELSAQDTAANIGNAIASMSNGQVWDAMETIGFDMGQLTQAMSNAGITAQQLNEIGSANFTALAANCGGSLSTLIFMLQNYNGQPIYDKNGNITANPAQLIDAQGRIYVWNGSQLKTQSGQAVVAYSSLELANGEVLKWNSQGLPTINGQALADSQQVELANGDMATWNGTNLVTQDGTVIIDEAQLTDCLGNMVEYNGTSLKPIHGNVYCDYSQLTSALGSVDALLAKDGSSATIVVETVNRTVNETVNKTSNHAAGGFRRHAAGGIALARHAAGGIATQAVPLDIVGEAGAEAIVPLTNKRYAKPFVAMIADGVAERGAGRGDVYQTFVFNQPVQSPVEIARTMRLEQRYGLAASR